MEENISVKDAERNSCIDIAKGLGILLVVFAHVNYTQPYQNLIYGFHMPLFFIISGMLFMPERYSDFGVFVKRKSKSLLCPYVLFALITVFCQMCYNFISDFGVKELLMTALMDALSFVYSRGSLFVTYNYPMWFVTCLFVVEVIFWFVSKLKGVAFWITAAAISVFGWYIQSDYCFTEAFSYLPWSINSACYVTGFLAIGWKLRPVLSRIAEKTAGAKWKTLLISLLLMIAMIPLALLNGKVSIGSKILRNGILMYVTGVLGTMSILALSQTISRSKVLQYCGRNSFYIMAMHVIFIGILLKCMEMVGLGGYNDHNIMQSILPFVAVFVASVLFSAVYVCIKNKIISKRRGVQP